MTLSPSSRRHFLHTASAAGLAALIPGGTRPELFAAEPAAAPAAETLAGHLHASLTPAQRQQICFPWNYQHPKFGLLRTRVANNWQATQPEVASDFFTTTQQGLIREIFESLITPAWQPRFDRQLEDDCGGFAMARVSRCWASRAPGSFSFC